MAFSKELIHPQDAEKYIIYRKLASSSHRFWAIDRTKDVFLRYLGQDRWYLGGSVDTWWLFYYQGVYLHLTLNTLKIEHLQANQAHVTECIQECALYKNNDTLVKIAIADLPISPQTFTKTVGEALTTHHTPYPRNHNKIDYCYSVTF